MKKQPTVRFPFLGIVVLLTSLALSGCGNNIKVHGKVTFPDGTPLTKGVVCFQNEQFLSRGPIASDGSYRLGMERDGSGIQPGHYQVYIADAIEVEKLPPSVGDVTRIPKETPLIDWKFMDPRTAELQCDVAKGMKLPFDITVEPPALSKKRR